MATDDERWARGADEFTAVTGLPAPPPGTDELADVVIDHVFAEVWTRPGLSRRDRRWIAITCACDSGAPAAMEVHFGNALRTDEITVDELREFILHYAAYSGFPKAVAARAALDAAVAQVRG